MNRLALMLAAAWLLPTAEAGAARSRTPDAIDGSALLQELKTSGVDKKRFEAYVKRRVGKINDRHKARMDFLARESDIWTSFWTKIRDERKLFEIRITRQMLDLFESLSSLDPADHAVSMNDFERMQSNVIKSFETQQRQKLAEFFAARDQRWREFVAAQERERSEFLAEGPADWQATRGNETAGSAPRRAKKQAAADEEEAEVAAAPARPAPKANGAPRQRSPAPASHWGN